MGNYSAADHLGRYPVIASEETVVLLSAVWRERLKKSSPENNERLKEIARTVYIPTTGPESWMRDSPSRLAQFLDDLRQIIGRRLEVEKREIIPGTFVYGYWASGPIEVLRIQKNYMIRFKGVRGAYNPISCKDSPNP